ncbi:MAG TPA: transcriptional repressor [Coriobacteriia bacterium]|nr:transcriptional repressor [Coriobacteriia bacterium]
MSANAPFGTMRQTAARRAIGLAVDAFEGTFTVDDLVATVRRDHASASIATVYRAVGILEASRVIERVGHRDGAALYVRCAHGSHHHHHIVCDSCGRTEETECPVGGVKATSVSGFVVTRHEVTLYGLCPDCAKTGGR